MPIIKSAKKRVKVARKATVRNVKTKRSLKGAIKAFHAAVTGKGKVAESHSKAQSELDKAVKKGIISKNKAARRKSQLATKAKTSGSKPVAAAKKAAPKAKPVVKKAVAKKAPVAKKPVAKMAPAKKK
jgi:small subunit ribosomal protein S20